MKVLITGGAGFIGTHLSRYLSANGHQITVLDNFSPQIHGTNSALAPDLENCIELVRGSVTDREELTKSLEDQDAVVHLAAETGTGQSMYEVERYSDVNLNGTALLLDLIVNDRSRFNIKKLVVASSRAIYGEGRYRCSTHGIVNPPPRSADRMSSGRFEPECPVCGSDCSAVPTDEDSPPCPSSFYGLTKRVQEDMVLLFGKTLGISAFALRYQNVFGPGQSLENPYTGILAVFSNQARAGKPINIFEDGLESRDFVYVEDVVMATARCLDDDIQGVHALNVGSGVGTSVLDVAREIVAHLRSESTISVSGAFRQGDIRHNTADLSRVEACLGYKPKWSFPLGLAAFLDWALAQEQASADSGYQRSLDELRTRGLMHG